ncbi:MAG: ATP-binding protein, partial [Actinomycetota bacterium]|nr:ATP-binding protein [Actinomycetota bacterium]
MAETKSSSRASYDASDIRVLEGLEAVRKRPAMYIGSTGPRGLHHLIWEVVDNAVDEAMAGACTRIDITLLADGGVQVCDNGRGIPVDRHAKTRQPALTTVLTTLHAGGKFDTGAYTVSGGLHGVGLSVVNALSRRLEVEVVREGFHWRQVFAYGKPMGPLERGKPGRRTGTQVTFWVDEEIFTETTEYDTDVVTSRLREMAFLSKGLQIRFSDQRGDEPVEQAFEYRGGLIDFVKYLNGSRDPIHPH